MIEKEAAREREFLGLLQETLKAARRKGGCISREEIGEIFGTLSLEEDQLNQIEAYLQAHKITVGENAGTGQEPGEEPGEEEDFLRSYREMLEAVPRLSESVLEALKISAMAGEISAQRELTEQMLEKVVEIARLYAGQGVGMEDLVEAGNEALVTGMSFLGHLESPKEVEGELGRRIMDSMEDLISMRLDEKVLDREMEDVVNLVADRARDLAGILGRKVTAQELAAEGEVTLEQIEDAVRLTDGKIEDLARHG